MPKDRWIQLAFDSKNTLYTASNHNLYSYDGVTWKLLASDSCNWTSNLIVDSRDLVWLSSACQHHDYFDGANWNDITPGNFNDPISVSGGLEEDLNGDMWTADNPVVKYKINITKTKNLNQANQQLQVFPNPARQLVTIECPENKGCLSIYNMFGFEIWSRNISQNKYEILLDKFIPGLYEVVWISSANKGRASLLIVE